jgi:hypothetical protein
LLLFTTKRIGGSENENSNKDHKNSQHSNAQATNSFKLKSIECGVEFALEALEMLYLMCSRLE